MPCRTEVAQGRELETGWVTEHLNEIKGRLYDYTAVDYRYLGVNSSRLDEMTAELCSCCRNLGSEALEKYSPYLRAWWVKHKAADEARKIMDDAFGREVPLPPTKRLILDSAVSESRDVIIAAAVATLEAYPYLEKALEESAQMGDKTAAEALRRYRE